MALTADQTAYVYARDENTCQLNNPGCTTTATLLHQVLSQDQMDLMRRDIDSPDSWIAACVNCDSRRGSEGS